MHEKFKCNIVLKGHETLVIDQNKKIKKIKSKSTALSKAGSGDVLTGIIAGFISQGLRPMEAMEAGVTLHQACAYRFEKNGNDHLSLRPVDIIHLIPTELKKLR